MLSLDDLGSGDVLLFVEHPTNLFYRILDAGIRWVTGSAYSHAAVVVRDPTWMHPDLRGLYVWESTYDGDPDPQDGRIKFGVQLTPVETYTRRFSETVTIYARVLGPEGRRNFQDAERLRQVHTEVYDKPYDWFPVDWARALLREGPNRLRSRFWCSAFVAYVHTRLRSLAPTTNWSEVRPQDLSSSSGGFLKWLVSLGPDTLVRGS